MIRSWANGETALPLVQRLMDHDCGDEAAVVARAALAHENCRDREELESALRVIASEPAGWSDALSDFARDPSEEKWDDLLRFVPDDVFYQRMRTTVPALMRLGCDGNVLFRCAARFGMTPDLFELAASGTVDPETIEARGFGSPARATWLGLAAQAAFARGDRARTIAYLKDATRNLHDAVFAYASLEEIREKSDDAFLAELESLELPELLCGD